MARHVPLPAVWEIATPGRIPQVPERRDRPGPALRRACGRRDLRRLPGEEAVASAGIARAARPVLCAAEAGLRGPRPLHAAQADLPVPEEPHPAHWQAAGLPSEQSRQARPPRGHRHRSKHGECRRPGRRLGAAARPRARPHQSNTHRSNAPASRQSRSRQATQPPVEGGAHTAAPGADPPSITTAPIERQRVPRHSARPRRKPTAPAERDRPRSGHRRTAQNAAMPHHPPPPRPDIHPHRPGPRECRRTGR
ncbi:hypothetical protein [Streptomyces sp. NPDC007991]|uniref:helix-turn-helix domain-containing protein n=1 Tax=Streptomyces sp. NPDC007991 TaxID=3364803 RepID=UPI0036E9C1A5